LIERRGALVLVIYGKDVVEGVFFCAVMASLSRLVLSDPLAFRPNPQNLIDNEQHSGEDRDTRSNVEDLDGIYRRPKLTLLPYTEAAADKRYKQQPVPNALSTLLYQDPSCLHVEGISDLGSMPSLPSNRAREIQRIEDSEKENFTRLVMKKKDARRRRKGEEDLALGGTGAGKGRKRGRGREDEFADVLHSVGCTKKRCSAMNMKS
jgi:U3 small nucleolar ribonucleoprotein protein LCP5